MKYMLTLLACAAYSILPAQNLPTEMFDVEIGKPAAVDGWKLEESGSDGYIYSIARPHPLLGDNAILAIGISPKSKIVTSLNLEAEFSSKSEAEIAFNRMKMAIEEQYNIKQLNIPKPIADPSALMAAYYRSANNPKLALSLTILSADNPQEFSVHLTFMDVGIFRAAEREATE